MNYSPDFDHVFRVNPDLSVSDVEDVWAPSVHYQESVLPGESDLDIESDDWEALTGYTGQWGHNGAIMHPSEMFAGPIYQDVMATPGVYVLVSVECWAENICPACGELPSYCQGHGSIGDRIGYRILLAHDRGWHGRCTGKGICEGDFCYESDPEPAGWVVLRHKEA